MNFHRSTIIAGCRDITLTNLNVVSLFCVNDVDLVVSNSDETLMGAECFFPSEE